MKMVTSKPEAQKRMREVVFMHGTLDSGGISKQGINSATWQMTSLLSVTELKALLAKSMEETFAEAGTETDLTHT